MKNETFLSVFSLHWTKSTFNEFKTIKFTPSKRQNDQLVEVQTRNWTVVSADNHLVLVVRNDRQKLFPLKEKKARRDRLPVGNESTISPRYSTAKRKIQKQTKKFSCDDDNWNSVISSHALWNNFSTSDESELQKKPFALHENASEIHS